MRGDNQVIINQDTMCEAMQMYFESEFDTVPVVQSVLAYQAEPNESANATAFVVKIGEKTNG